MCKELATIVLACKVKSHISPNLKKVTIGKNWITRTGHNEAKYQRKPPFVYYMQLREARLT